MFFLIHLFSIPSFFRAQGQGINKEYKYNSKRHNTPEGSSPPQASSEQINKDDAKAKSITNNDDEQQ